jgi:hypothetical protein
VRETFSNNNLSDLFVSEGQDTREEMDLPGISTIQKMVVEMPDGVPDAPKIEKNDSTSVEKVKQESPEKNHKTYSTTTNSLTDLVVPEEDGREEMDLPGMATIQKMVFEMPDEVPESPRLAKNDSTNVEKVKEESLEKNRKTYSTTTNSLTDLVVPEEDDREEMDLPGMATIQKMVFEMPDEVPETPTAHPSSMKKYEKDDLEQLTADFQTMPVFERKSSQQESDKPKSLNSKLNMGLKIGMNDRMGFVKHLFNGSNQDFNRVMSQLTTINSYEEAKNLIQTMIKPDYNNWDGKESYENRFMELVERKYQ